MFNSLHLGNYRNIRLIEDFMSVAVFVIRKHIN